MSGKQFRSQRMLKVRKLAAIDLEFLGQKVILTEFGLGVAGSTTLGFSHCAAASTAFYSAGMIVLGAYLLLLGINYAPPLLHAIDLPRLGGASQEMADELGDKRAQLFASTAGSRCSFCSLGRTHGSNCAGDTSRPRRAVSPERLSVVS